MDIDRNHIKELCKFNGEIKKWVCCKVDYNVRIDDGDSKIYVPKGSRILIIANGEIGEGILADDDCGVVGVKEMKMD